MSQPEVSGQFTVSGLAGKTLIIRALGPSLAASGVAGVISDPVLELRNSAGRLIAQNDNWADTQQALFSAGGRYAAFRPTDNRESAIAVTLPPGTYTASLHGESKKAGDAVLEWNDVSSNAASNLSNISASGLVETGENMLVASVTVVRASSGAIIRALGRSDWPDATALADPALELYDSNGSLIASNNNWQDDAAQAQALSTRGLAPGSPSEAALVVALSPGRYTAVIRGQASTSGMATLCVALMP